VGSTGDAPVDALGWASHCLSLPRLVQIEQGGGAPLSYSQLNLAAPVAGTIPGAVLRDSGADVVVVRCLWAGPSGQVACTPPDITCQ